MAGSETKFAAGHFCSNGKVNLPGTEFPVRKVQMPS